MTDETPREQVVAKLREHADQLDTRELTLREASDETRRLARDVETSARRVARTDGGATALSQARQYGLAGLTLTERAMANVLYAVTFGLWAAAGASGLTGTALACVGGGVVSLTVANRLKGWSA